VTRVVILSDTHNQALPSKLIDFIEKSDIILHAGDFTGMDTYGILERFGKPLYGVLGNMDDDALKGSLPVKRVVTVEGLAIALIHGWGSPLHLSEKVAKEFDGMEWDVLVFGHSHSPFFEKKGKKTVINPGSPTDKRFARHNSFVWAEVDGKRFDHRFIEL